MRLRTIWTVACWLIAIAVLLPMGMTFWEWYWIEWAKIEATGTF
jgi:hypothetical protein